MPVRKFCPTHKIFGCQDWWFTFGWGQPHHNCYVIIHGTRESARQEMIIRYGQRWAMQYGSAKEAGVETFKLAKLEA